MVHEGERIKRLADNVVRVAWRAPAFTFHTLRFTFHVFVFVPRQKFSYSLH